MRRCEDEKMRYRPPLLEEPCAQTLSGKMNVTLQTEVMDDKIYGLMIEWCETPRNKRAGCAYKDLCFVYDSQEGSIMFVQPSHALKLALPDPVLQAAACLD